MYINKFIKIILIVIVILAAGCDEPENPTNIAYERYLDGNIRSFDIPIFLFMPHDFML